MNWLAENALPIWACGAVALTMALVIYFQTRTNGALFGVVAVLGVTGVLLLVEWAAETSREAVERTLYELADAVEANDIQGALQFVSPGASQIRNDIETLMPLVTIDTANIMGSPLIEVNQNDRPPSAKVECRGFFHGTMKQNGMKGGDAAQITIYFVSDDDRWLVSEYAPNKDWRRELPRRRGTATSR
jgi:hypothetical protein